MTRLVAERESMTVGELISVLSHFDENLPVYYRGTGWSLHPFNTVDNDYAVDDTSGNFFSPVVIE